MKKISKREARNMYLQYKDFIMCASNLKPEVFGVKIDAHSFERMIEADFDEMVNMFSYYNCVNGETGKRAAFYVED